jgi:hypothetical protein
MTTPPIQAAALLQVPPRIINIGLEVFATQLQQQGVRVVHVNWRPPAGGNAELLEALRKLSSNN